MKGFAFIIIPLILVVTVIATLVFATFFKLHITRVMEIEISQNNAQLALLSLLSSTKDGKNVGEIISEKIISGDKDMGFVKDKLDKIIPSQCYTLEAGSTVMVSTESSSCKPSAYESRTLISIPYSPDSQTQQLTLVMN